VNADSEKWEEAERAEARYANSFRVGFNAFEVLIDFGQLTAEGGRPLLQSRIITNPRLATELMRTLEESLRHHASEFGPIPEERES
jgi:hypothetical protein